MTRSKHAVLNRGVMLNDGDEGNDDDDGDGDDDDEDDDDDDDDDDDNYADADADADAGAGAGAGAADDDDDDGDRRRVSLCERQIISFWHGKPVAHIRPPLQRLNSSVSKPRPSHINSNSFVPIYLSC